MLFSNIKGLALMDFNAQCTNLYIKRAKLIKKYKNYIVILLIFNKQCIFLFVQKI